MRRARSLLWGIVTVAALVPAATLAAPRAALAAPPTPGPAAGGSALYFAEGNTLPGWYEFITTLNPSLTATATVVITYACEEPAGTKVSCNIPDDTVTRTIAPQTRDTVSVFDPAGGGVDGTFTGVGATLRSNLPVVSERPMYMEQPGGAFSQILGGRIALWRAAIAGH